MTQLAAIIDAVIVGVLIHEGHFGTAAGWFSSSVFIRMWKLDRRLADLRGTVNEGER